MTDERENASVGFAPSAPQDSRDKGDWESRYNTDAKKHIRIETAYLLILLLLTFLGVFAVWIDLPQKYLGLLENKNIALKVYGYSLLGGLLGGTLFSLKYLYHSVARAIWNIDRRLWRTLTPLLSAALAFANIVLMRSGLFSVFDVEALNSGTLVFAISFLAGYFSDSAIAKFAEIANTIFGYSKVDQDSR